jgi:hypothetical protein
MKKLTSKLSLLSSRRDTRVVVFILTIAMYIISAGAPEATGGIGL